MGRDQPEPATDNEKHSFDIESANPDEKSAEIAPPPDGGYVAWGHALLAHLVFFNTWGVTNSFGTFQQIYSASLGRSQTDIAWIGSIQICLLFLVGTLTGGATDAGYFKQVFAFGVFLQLLGLFMTSLCTTYWQILLAQGLCLGLGNGFTFCPALAVLSSYFSRNRAFAVGIAAAGAAIGGLIYPAVANGLFYHRQIGLPWTVRIMAFIMMLTYIPCLIWFKPRLPPRKAGPFFDMTAFKEKPFVFFTASMFFNFAGLYFAFFFLGTYARDRVGMNDSLKLVMVLNGVGVIGRIAPGLIGDRYTGMLNLLVPLSFSASILVYAWPAITSEAGLYAFAVVYGLIAASLQALFPATASTMTPEASRTGTRVGMIFTIVSIANLTAPAIEGQLVQGSNQGYLHAQMFAATSIFIGALFAVAARVARAGYVLQTKV